MEYDIGYNQLDTINMGLNQTKYGDLLKPLRLMLQLAVLP